MTRLRAVDHLSEGQNDIYSLMKLTVPASRTLLYFCSNLHQARPQRPGKAGLLVMTRSASPERTSLSTPTAILVVAIFDDESGGAIIGACTAIHDRIIH